MAKTITLHNIEKLIFENNEIRSALPDRKALFHTWALSRQSPDLKAMGQKVILELLNGLTAEELTAISVIWKEPVNVEKLVTNVVEHYNCKIDDAERVLNADTIVKEAFFVYREGDQFYLSTWR